MSSFDHSVPSSAFSTHLQAAAHMNIPGHPEAAGSAAGEASTLGQKIGVSENITESLNACSNTTFVKTMTGGLFETPIFPAIEQINMSNSFKLDTPLSTTKNLTLFSQKGMK